MSCDNDHIIVFGGFSDISGAVDFQSLSLEFVLHGSLFLRFW